MTPVTPAVRFVHWPRRPEFSPEILLPDLTRCCRLRRPGVASRDVPTGKPEPLLRVNCFDVTIGDPEFGFAEWELPMRQVLGGVLFALSLSIACSAAKNDRHGRLRSWLEEPNDRCGLAVDGGRALHIFLHATTSLCIPA